MCCGLFTICFVEATIYLPGDEGTTCITLTLTTPRALATEFAKGTEILPSSRNLLNTRERICGTIRDHSMAWHGMAWQDNANQMAMDS